MANKNEYIHNVAGSVMGQIRLVYAGTPNSDWYECDDDGYPQQVWQHYGHKVVEVVGKMGASARGRIAACGVEPGSPTGNLCYYEVNSCKDLGSAKSGNQVLTLLASYVVVAAMIDLIRAAVEKARRVEQDIDELCEDDSRYRAEIAAENFRVLGRAHK